jgi:protein SCO1/2
MNKRNAIKSVAAALCWRALQCFLLALRKKVEFRGIDITGAEYARDLPLTDHNGQQRSLKRLRGQGGGGVFGYTQCPDVCPTSMSELAEVKRSLGADGDRLQGIFVTVDPERDTPRC